jgi:hypothetical protein
MCSEMFIRVIYYALSAIKDRAIVRGMKGAMWTEDCLRGESLISYNAEITP